MSIPLDQLYHHLDTINNEMYNDCILIYHFYPHGSKNIENLQPLSHYKLDYFDKICFANMIMYDQEPLQYDYYYGGDIVNYNCSRDDANSIVRPFKWPITDETTPQELEIIEIYKNLNLRFLTGNAFSVFDLTLLTHSEKNSPELKKYEANGFIGVYWWCHAVIAQDWFRYSQHVKQKKQVKKTFLIYNRAWSGTREYRLKFAEWLIRLELEDQCQTNINPVEPEDKIHYKTHKFSNPTWRPGIDLENHFAPTDAASWSSATIALDDYESTDIEVVLETLFDDPRQQLTEKALRPIACAQPFILASTVGSLEYLRGYGFKTFDSVWDEEYDLIEDPKERLIRIVELMRQIANWDPKTRFNKMRQAQSIADYNKKLFFSTQWRESIIDEYKNNLSNAMQVMKNNITAVNTRKIQQLKPDSVVTSAHQETRRKIFETVDKVKEKFNQ
jgi:hypothetical protein